MPISAAVVSISSGICVHRIELDVSKSNMILGLTCPKPVVRGVLAMSVAAEIATALKTLASAATLNTERARLFIFDSRHALM